MTSEQGDDYGCYTALALASAGICGFLAILAVFSYRVRFYVKLVYYSLCIVLGGTIGAIISIPFGRTTNNHLSVSP
ncbi:unnamed protein product [Strongylus vulgaris]|uniref:Uncharacterized protein n=1 Tax=Strongylus vulgaris TaxID=40348 RepID=A0A3P7LIR3_STRVU|nr:unnamed protein product [Strongylus vulgaris]